MFRPLIKWKEPKEYLAALDKIEDAKEKPWHRPVGAALAIISLLVLRALTPNAEPMPMLVLGLLCISYAWFIAWGVPWVNKRCSSTVQLFKKRVVQTRGSRTISVSLKSFASYYWLSNEDFYTLILVYRNNDARSWKRFESFGVRDDAIKNEVTAILQTTGFPETPIMESAIHLQTFASPLSWKRIFLHLCITLALIIGSILVLGYYPPARSTLRVEGCTLLVLGLPLLYLVLTLALSGYLKKKKERLRKASEDNPE